MKTLFVCWSGDRSNAAASMLARRLPAIVPDLECLVSTQIEVGRLWPAELQRQLVAADAGLVCLTTEAVRSPWIHYEAGMLAAEVGKERGEPIVFTYLLDLEPRELSGPLGAYQAATATREDTRRLVDSLLRFVGTEDAMDFDAWWSELSEDLQRIPPARLEGVIPDLPQLFDSQTFVEPMMECTNQRWLGRHDKALEVLGRLDQVRPRVRAGCRPAVADVYDELCRLVEGYAMDLGTFFLSEMRFDPDQETGLLPITGAALSAERRRADIRRRLSELDDLERAPLGA
jgi:TIR domain